MTHRIVRYEFRTIRGKRVVRAMGRTARGTTFLIDQAEIDSALMAGVAKKDAKLEAISRLSGKKV